MKKFLLSVLTAVTLLSCNSNSYKLNGILPDKDSDGKMVYLTNYDTNDTLDSVVVKGDKFELKGEIEAPVLAKVIGAVRGTLILESGDIVYDWENEKLSGSPLNDKFNALSDEIGKLEEEGEAFQNDSTKTLEAKQKFDEVVESKYLAICQKAYDENIDNPIGFYFFFQCAYGKSVAELEALLSKAPKSVKESIKVKKWIANAKANDEHGEGTKFVDFSITKEDGSVEKLSDYVGKGKYTLVDFWAYWCPNCIQEMPLIKELYDNYHSKGLDVLGVTVWNYDLDLTNKAIAKHKMTWQQIHNTKDIATNVYGISGIPHVIIIGPDGTILSRGLQGADLKAKVEELMTK